MDRQSVRRVRASEVCSTRSSSSEALFPELVGRFLATFVLLLAAFLGKQIIDEGTVALTVGILPAEVCGWAI